MLDAHRGEPLADVPREPAAGLLHDDGEGKLAHEPRDGLEAAREVPIAPGLDQLHGGVQMNAECIGTHASRERLDLRGRHGTGLHDAEVAEHEGPGRDVANGVRSLGLGADVHRALAAKAEAEAALLRDRGELVVDPRRLVRAAGHRRDQERRTERLAEDGGRGVDRVGVQIGQRVVNEPHLLEERCLVAEGDLVGRTQREVVGFTLSNRAHCRGLPLRYRNSSKKSESTRIRTRK